MKEFFARKNIRLQNFDYSQEGYYFITFCTKDNRKLFGEVVGTTAPGRPRTPGILSADVSLTPLGLCLEETIQLANKRNVKIDKHIIMPNHVHMIIIIGQTPDDRERLCTEQTSDDRGRSYTEQTSDDQGRSYTEQTSEDRGRSSLQEIVRNIKSYITKKAGFKLWQPRFYDRIIRSEDEYQRIWNYIDNNPIQWIDDEYYQ